MPLGLTLAPMAGVTDHAFRVMCRRFGAEYAVSEMVSAKALVYEQRSRVSPVTAPLLSIGQDEGPVSVQLFGRDPAFLAEAARMVSTGDYRGFSGILPSAIDLNMGCPVRKVAGNGEGSALLDEPELAEKIVRSVVCAVSLPVTVKIRLGRDLDHIVAPDFAARMEEAGASALTVHARTREEGYRPGIHPEVIAAVKKRVKIPVIGNGDIFSAQDAGKMLAATACDGLAIARGAMGRPWIFSEIASFLRGEDFVPPSLSERAKIAEEHFLAMLSDKGDRALSEAKKQMSAYVQGIHGAAALRVRLMGSKTKEEFIENIRAMAGEE